MSQPEPLPPATRRVYANRTLNLRAIKAIGCDMDYTLIHYRHELWERRAYEHVAKRMAEKGWPVAGLSFDAEFATRGLILDLELGNLVKASRFVYVNGVSNNWLKSLLIFGGAFAYTIRLIVFNEYS